MNRVSIILFWISHLIAFVASGQTVFGALALDTVDYVVTGCYPVVFRSAYKGLPEELLEQYPNRNYVHFDETTDQERDSLVIVHLSKFELDFNKTLHTTAINKKTNEFFYTFYFNSDGQLAYIFYNWDKFPDLNEIFNKAFIAFATRYDFGGLPKGKPWSQCVTLVYSRKEKNKHK